MLSVVTSVLIGSLMSAASRSAETEGGIKMNGYAREGEQ